MEGENFDSALQSIKTLSQQQNSCGQSFDGNVSLFYSTPFAKEAISGYLNFSLPSSYKFIVTNPFGQPVFMIAGDKNSFQSINVPARNYVGGSIRSFFLRHNIPLSFLNGNWGEWLTGRNTITDAEIITIRQDKDSRGIWIVSALTKGKKITKSYLLFDAEKDVYLKRLLENSEGKLIAEISYDNWSDQTACKQPLKISLSDLGYGITISLKFSKIRFKTAREKYSLPIPGGYNRQFMP